MKTETPPDVSVPAARKVEQKPAGAESSAESPAEKMTQEPSVSGSSSEPPEEKTIEEPDKKDEDKTGQS